MRRHQAGATCEEVPPEPHQIVINIINWPDAIRNKTWTGYELESFRRQHDLLGASFAGATYAAVIESLSRGGIVVAKQTVEFQDVAAR
jgi:hypothetical protein